MLPYPAGLRIEPRSFLDQHLQIIVGRQRTMLDFGATSQSRSAHRVFVSVNKRTQSEFVFFVARRVELVLRKRHIRPADAVRGKDLDEVSASFLLLAHERANLIRRA